jgi:hypothetical protein
MPVLELNLRDHSSGGPRPLVRVTALGATGPGAVFVGDEVRGPVHLGDTLVRMTSSSRWFIGRVDRRGGSESSI